MRLSRRVAALAMGVLSAFAGVAETTVTMETPAFALSIKHDGIRASAGAETLTYSSLWDGGEGSTATIAQDGTALWTGLADEGEKEWTVSRNGTYVLTHTTSTDGAAGKVETATFIVSGKDEPFAEGDIAAVGHSAAYDGEAHGISVTAPDGASVRYSLSASGPFEAENPSFKNVCDATTVWFEVTKAGFIPYTNSATIAISPRPVTLTSGMKTDFVYDGTDHEFPVLTKSENGFVTGEGITTSNWATVTTVAQGQVANTFDYAPIEGTDLANYEITVVTGKIAVVKGSVVPDGNGEPGGGDVPEDGLSKFDAAVVVYDGEGHTIDTNALVKAFKAAMAGAEETRFAYARDDGSGGSGHAGRVTLPTGDGDVAWSELAPAFTNAGEHVVWYRVTNPNYEDFAHAAKVTITKRPVTLTSGTKTDFVYDGSPHEFPVLAKSGNSDEWFVAGEGITTSNWAKVTTVAQGQVANAFDYEADENTDLANYEIAVVTGKIAVVEAGIPVGPTGAIMAVGYTNVYDGAVHGVSVSATGLLTEPTVQYRASETADDWADASPTFSNVCDTQVWWRVSAPNYADATGTIGVKITSRPVTVKVEGKAATFAYDGEEKSVCGYDISTEDTLYDATANTTFRGEAVAADTPTISRTDVGVTAMNLKSADFANGNANFEVTYEVVSDGSLTVTSGAIVVAAQGYEAEYDGEGHSVTVDVMAPAGLVPKYALAKDGPYSADAPMFTNICSDVVVWFVLEADQYAAVTNSATVTILKRPLAEASLAAIPNQVYTGAEIKPPLSFTDAGSRKVTERDYTAVYSDNGRVGTATVTITATDGGNYSGEVVAHFNIDKATHDGDGGEPGGGDVPEGGLSKFDAAAVVYDGEGHTIDTNALVKAFNAAMAGAGETRFAYALDDGSGESGGAGRAALPWADTAPVFTNAGEYVVWYRVTNPNYEDFVHAAKVTITKRPVTVTVKGKTATYAYDTTEKSVCGYDISTEDALYDATANTKFRGEDVAADTPTISRTDVGVTAMNLKAADFANDNANFDVTYDVTDGGVTVTPRVIGDDPANWDIRLAKNPMYDGDEKSAPITQVAFVKPDGNLDNIPYELSGNTATDAGNYVVRITGKGNYSGTAEKDWAITPRNITLTSGGATWGYDGAAHSEKTVSVGGDGFASGEGATYSGFPVVRHVADAAEPIANAFSYTFNANTKARNYEVTTGYGTVQMTPRAVTLTAPTKEKPYDGTPLTFGAGEIEISETGHAGRVTLPNDEAFTLGNFSSLMEAGRVEATFTVADGTALMDDYAITIVPGTLTVTKSAAQITVTAKSSSWVYDGQPHTLHEYEATNIAVLQSGDVLEVTFDDASVVTTPQDGEARDGVVENAIASVRVMRGDVDVTANYTVEWFPGTLTVTKRPVAVKVVGKTATFVYDGNEKSAEGCDLSTDDELYDIGADIAFSGVAEAARTDAGKTEMGLSAADFTNNNECFDVTYAVTDGWVKVDPLDIAAAGDGIVLELGANPKYNGNVQSVAVESVTCNGLLVTYTLAGENATHAGTYTLTVKGNGNFCGERSTTWKVLKRGVTLMSGSASKVYDGAPLVCGEVSVGGDGFIGLEGATFEVTGSQTAAGSSKNTFAYSLKAGTLASDYEITTVEGDLTVTKAKYPGQEDGGAGIRWSVAADAATWVYDGQPHGVSLTGVPEGVTARLSENTATDAGNYRATVTLDYDAANYEAPVAPAPLDWSITPRPVTVTVEGKTATFAFDGEEKSVCGYDISTDDELYDIVANTKFRGEAVAATEPAISRTNVGVTAMNLKPADFTNADANFDVTYAVTDGSLTVTLGEIVYVAQNCEVEYDGEGHSVAVRVSAPVGLVPKYALAKDGPYSADAPAFTNACSDVVVWFALEADKYAAVTNSAKVTISKRPLATATLAAIPDQVYTGSEIKPPLSFADSGCRKVTDKDYAAVYSDNGRVGTATVRIAATEDGNYSGEVVANFNIVKATYDMSAARRDYASAFTYDGLEKSVAVTGLPSGVTVKEIVDGRKTAVGDYVAKATFDYDAANYNEPALADCPWRILRAEIGDDDGGEPGEGDAPEGGLSKFDAAVVVYDGEGHTIDTNALVKAFKAAMAGAEETRFAYARGDGSGGSGHAGRVTLPTGDGDVAWSELAPAFTNAGEHVVWYRVTNPNYEDFAHAAKVTITKRPVTLTSGTKTDFVYDGSPHEFPVLAKSENGFVAGEGITTSNWATVTTVAQGEVANTFDYAPIEGTDLANYEITVVTGKIAVVATTPPEPEYAALAGTLAWKLNLATGCYTAHLKLACTNGFENGISDLRFVYQDRMDGAIVASCLWNSSARTKRPSVTLGGVEYRAVALDAARLTAQGATAVYGVRDVSQPLGTVASNECEIELYVRNLAKPLSDIAYVTWKSNGAQCSLPISAAGGSQGMTVSGTMLGAVRLASSASRLAAPLSTAALSRSLAVGVVLDEASSPYCRLADFSVADGVVRGRVEVGKVASGVETRGALGANARVALLGAASLDGGFAELGGAAVDADGAFRFDLGGAAARFFKVRIDVENVVE